MSELSLEEAYDRWADDLVRYATALVGPGQAPDVVSETFSILVVNGDARWLRIKEPRAYLYRSVMNTVRMQKRSERRRQRRELSFAGADQQPELLSDPAVLAAVRTLSDQQRAAIFLTYWEDLGVDDVARLLAVSNGTVKRHLARARVALRKAIAK